MLQHKEDILTCDEAVASFIQLVILCHTIAVNDGGHSSMSYVAASVMSKNGMCVKRNSLLIRHVFRIKKLVGSPDIPELELLAGKLGIQQC